MRKLHIALLTVLVLFQTILSPFGTYGVTFANTSETGGTTSTSQACTTPQAITNTLTAFSLTLDGKQITNTALELPKGAEGEAKFTFTASTEDCPIIGAYFEFKLPESIVQYTNNSFSQTKTNNEGVKYSYTYDSANNKVKVTLDEIPPAGVSTNANFEFTFKSGFNQDKLNNSTGLEHNIVIPKANGGEDTIPVTILPSNSGAPLTKEVSSGSKATINSDGTRTMDWKIVVNKGGKKLNNAKITDTMTGGHTLTGQISVKTLEINLNGSFNDKGTASYNSFEDITLSGRNAYEITYKSVVNLAETDKVGSKTFDNSVSVKEGNTTIFGPVKKSVTTTYGEPLAKAKDTSKANNNYESNWYIDFNFNQANLADSDAWVQDIITGSHKIDPSSIEVYEVNVNDDGTFGSLGSKVSNYDLTQGTVTNYNGKDLVDSFKLQFKSNYHKAYRIYYKAIFPDDFYTNQKGENVTNKVTSGNVSVDKGSSHWIKEGIGVKEHTIDFENKVITWQIKIKSDSGKPITSFTIGDTFTGDHTLIDRSNDGQITATYFKVTNVSNANFSNIDPSNGFTMTGDVDADKEAVIEYQTKFAIDAQGQPVSTSYGNTAEIKWSNYTINESSSYTPNPSAPTTLNGSKKGSYNYQTQEFDWKISVNTNKVNINGAVLTDIIGPGHEITGPITVNEYTLANPDNDSSGTIGQQLTSGYTINPTNPKSGTFTLTFDNNLGAANNKTYIIQYKTKDIDNIMGIDSQTVGANPEYTNEATFQVGSRTTNLGKVEIPVDFGNSILVKNEPTNVNSPVINWKLDVNKSHSSLGETTLTDIPSGYLKLIEGSIELRQYNVTSSGISNGSSWVKAENEPGVTVSYLANGGFELKFHDLSKIGYEIKYSTLVLGQKDTDGKVEENEKFSNYATLKFAGSENLAANQQTASDANKSWNFQYSSSDSDFSTTKGNLSFVKKGVDPTTGQKVNLEGAEFELVKRINGTDYVFAKATSDANGFFEFKNVNYGNYIVKETKTPTDYKTINSFNVKLSAANDTDLDASLAPYEVVNTKNVTLACTQFTITIKDVDGKLMANTPVKIVNVNGTELTYTTDGNGQIKLPNTVTAGEYKVVTNTGTTTEKELGKVTVQFGSDCNAEVQPAPVCDNFTVVVKDGKGNIRTDITSLTLKQGNTVVATQTATNGKVLFTSNKLDSTNGVKPGTYSVYEGNLYLGDVTLSYKEVCGYEFVVTEAPSCPTFTITLKDVDDQPRQGVTVKVKDTQGNEVQAGTTFTTDANGQVTINSLPKGSYELHEVDSNGTETKLKDFTVNTECKVEYQPALACANYVIAILDENGNAIPDGTQVTVNGATAGSTYSKQVTVVNGKVTIPSSEIPADKYTITYGTKTTEEFTVTHNYTDCGTTVKEVKTPIQASCPNYEITVKNKDGVLTNTDVTLKHTDGTTVISSLTTDGSGKVTIPSTSKAGTYTVHVTENGQDYNIGKVVVNYVDNCVAEVTPTNACPIFTLTVNNVSGQPRENASVVIKDNAGTTTIATGTTDANGQLKVTYKVENGTYTLYEVRNGQEVSLGTITVKDCVQSAPPVCDQDKVIPGLPPSTNVIINEKTYAVNPDGTVTVPGTEFPLGTTVTVKDATGKEVGTITFTDCTTGTFYYPACEKPTITLPTYENKGVFILSETAVGGPITSPDIATVDVALVVTSEDAATVDINGKLTIDKSKLVNSNEYYIVDGFGKILKIIKLDGGDIVVFTPNRMEEVRIEECVQKNPIPLEPGEPTEPNTPPTNPGEPTEPNTPPTNPGEP
ncbi:MAG: SpaA isopeptide-forming pilin-related protein, partial [Lysinibacillus sp.]